MERDHLWHVTYYEYGDSFADGVNRHTFAFPTKVIDPRNYESTTKYHYDNGLVTEMRTPGSGTGAAGDPVQYATTAMQYDAAGRIEQVTQVNDGAYTRWVYPASMGYLQKFTRVEAGQPEMRFEEHYDGAGRMRATSQTFPDSVEAYRGVFQLLDVMGRVVRRSNPTKINAGWVPFGEDDRWRYTDQTYDWQGRPTVTTNTDGTTREQSYGGCGCAGGEVVTARDEHGRHTRLSKDALGRLVKTEELNLNGAGVYSTATYAYNGRDRLTSIMHAGLTRSFEYDGHGRLWRKTIPEHGAANEAAGTTEYTYNADDTLWKVRDPRGVVTTYGYSYRHELESISHDVSAAPGVEATAGVVFTYDAAGNRTSMTDGAGTTRYGYDALARLTDETHTFNGLAGSYRLDYRYNLAGQLRRLTRNQDKHVDYVRDYAGQVTAVGNTGYADNQPYATGIGYRTSGALAAMTYGNGRTLSLSYDRRQHLARWDVAGLMGWDCSYDYFNEKTGRVTFSQNLYDQTLDRSYEYDHVRRLAYSWTGAEAHAHAYSGQWPTEPTGPYAQSYSYDERGNLTGRQGWGGWNASSSYLFNAKNRNTLLTL